MLRERGEEVRRRLKAAFEPGSPAEWAEGFRIAMDFGPALVPLLVDAFTAESQPKRRHLLLGAIGLARGPAASEFLLRIASGGRTSEERGMACIALALHPGWAGSPDALLKVLNSGQESEFGLAATCLALAAFTQRKPIPARILLAQEPAVAAAALFAHGGEVPAAVERWFEGSGEGGAILVRRAALLADPGTARSDRARRAEAALRANPAPALRRAAALALALEGEPAKAARGDGGPGPDLLPLLSATESGRRALRQRGWLAAVPSSLLPAPLRERQVVAWVAGSDWQEVSAGVAQLAQDASLRRILGDALAWRLLHDQGTGTTHRLDDALVQGLAESPWLAVARGRPPRTARAEEDPRAARVLAFAGQGRIPPRELALRLEEVLVTRGVHPGLALAEEARSLLRDALLAGSRYGGSRLSGRADPGLDVPRGIPPDRAEFFEPACELFEFSGARAPVLAPAARLRP